VESVFKHNLPSLSDMSDNGGGSRKKRAPEDEGEGGGGQQKKHQTKLSPRHRELTNISEHSPAGINWAVANPEILMDQFEGARTRSGLRARPQKPPLNCIEAEDINQEDIFQIPFDGSLMVKSIDLVTQLQLQLERPPDEDNANDLPSDSDEPDDVPQSSVRKIVVEATHSFQTQMKDESKTTCLCVAVLGLSAEGKSSLINWMLQVCLCVSKN